MTRILLRRFYALAVAALFIVIVMVSVTSVAPAQRTASRVDNSGHVSMNSSRTKMSGVALDQQDPLFLPAVIYIAGGADPNDVALADVNGDGKLDAVVANGGGWVGVLLGNGDGTFQPVVSYAAGNFGESPYPRTIAVGDVNGDHKPDIVLGNEQSPYRFSLLIGNGDGTFQPVVGIDQSFNAYSVSLVVADVNRDGSLDVVTGSACFTLDDCSTGAVNVSLGNGDGTFQPAVRYRVVCGGMIAVAVADVNGDGIPDVVASVCLNGACTNGGTGAAAVLLGRGDGTFDSPVTYDAGGNAAWSIAVSDVNRDGKPDLLLANGDGVQENGGVVDLLLGNGDGTFQSAVPVSTGTGRARAVAAQDVDGDGAPDILVAPYFAFGDPVAVLLGHGDGTFASAAFYGLYPLELATSIVAGDVNGDGRPDLIVTAHPIYGGGLAVLLNNTGPHSPSTTTLVSDVNPAAPRQPVTYAATVTGETGEGLVGTVAFMDGSSTIAEVKLVNNRAAYTTMYKWSEPTRTHAISVKYSGDLYNASSTSTTLTEYVGYFPVPSKIDVTTSASPSLVGQPVTFAANVRPADAKYGAIPDGELVWFYDGTTVLGSVALAGGRAEYTTSALSARTHRINATYPGDSIFKPAADAITQIVNKNATTTTLHSNPNPSAHGQAVTFTAKVRSPGPVPTGKVKFMDGTTAIGSATLSGGVAKLVKSNLAGGTHSITAQYLGDAVSTQSTSSVLDQEVR